MLPLYAPVRLSFHRQDQSCYVAIPCAVLTMALLTDQLFGLEYAHVYLGGFLYALSHAQSEGRFEYVSCAND